MNVAKDQTMTARSVSSPVSFMTFVKSIGGCAFIALCFAGATAAVVKLPFSPTAQLVATIVGAVIGGILAWRTGNSSAQN
jgi:hypothetical protein